MEPWSVSVARGGKQPKRCGSPLPARQNPRVRDKRTPTHPSISRLWEAELFSPQCPAEMSRRGISGTGGRDPGWSYLVAGLCG